MKDLNLFSSAPPSALSTKPEIGFSDSLAMSHACPVEFGRPFNRGAMAVVKIMFRLEGVYDS